MFFYPGDGGVPLIFNGYVIGIFSHQNAGTTCQGNIKVVYTAIYRYYDWINAKLKLANNAQSWA
jgi:secreted trypsin-like serine protease